MHDLPSTDPALYVRPYTPFPPLPGEHAAGADRMFALEARE